MDFYRDHLTPFMAMPNPPTLTLLLAAQHRVADGLYENALWTTELNTLITRAPTCAVGIGGMFADIQLTRLWDREMDVDTVKLLAAYVVFLTKESIEGCGKWTEVLSLTNGRLDPRWSYEGVQALEGVFRKYLTAEAAAFDYFIATPDRIAPKDRTVRPLSAYIKKLQGEVRSVMKKVTNPAAQ
jgi:hypothetical protein